MATQFSPNSLDERDAQSIIALLRRLMNELSTLVRQEIALASAEVARSVRTLVASASSVAIGGAVLYAGALVLLASAVLGLSNVVDPWLAALIVGVAVGIIGYVMVHAGIRKLKAENLKPERLKESLQRDKEVLTRHTP